MTFDEFCGRISALRLDRSGGVPKPYKPLMLAAVVLLIHKGKIASRNVYLDGGLRSAFEQLLRMLYPQWPRGTKPEYPFRHLESDGVWKLVPLDGATDELRAAKSSRAEAWVVLRHVRCAELDPVVFERLSSNFEDRFRVLQSLAATYFPPATSGRLWNVLGDPYVIGDAGAGRVGERLTERALEEHLEANWDATPFATLGVRLSEVNTTGLPGRQVLTPVNSIDLLGYRPERREWWVFELKRGRPSDAVVGQISRYLGWMRREHSGDGRGAVGAIIARRIDQKLRLAASEVPAVSLWTFDDRLELTRAD